VRAGACSAEAVAASGEAAAAPDQPGAAPAAANGLLSGEGPGGGRGPAAELDGSIPLGVIALPPPTFMTPAPNLLDKDMQVRGISAGPRQCTCVLYALCVTVQLCVCDATALCGVRRAC
jgi:hypothetical protein